jgi:hypothetical protein
MSEPFAPPATGHAAATHAVTVSGDTGRLELNFTARFQMPDAVVETASAMVLHRQP